MAGYGQFLLLVLRHRGVLATKEWGTLGSNPQHPFCAPTTRSLVHRGDFLTIARATAPHACPYRWLTTNQGALDMCTSHMLQA